MKANRIELKKYTAESKLNAKEPENVIDLLLECSSPELIDSFGIEQEEEARAALAKYPACTCEKVGTYAGYVWRMEGYALEYFETDEDGDFIEGSDFVFADDVINQ